MFLAHSKMRASKSDRIFDFVNYSLLILALLIVAYPLWFVVIASVSSSSHVLNGEVTLLPKGFQLKAYEMVFQNRNIVLGYRNTIFYTAAGTSINIVATVLIAYTLAQSDLRGRGPITFLLSFTMFFSGGLIPTYLVYRSLGIINTRWVMILPGMISVYNVIIARTFFQNSIPSELQDAAYIDGASALKTLTWVVIPLSKPILAVLTIFYGVGHWNSFFNALVFLSKNELYPLQLVLRNILITGAERVEAVGIASVAEQVRYAESIKYAVIIVSSVPVLLLYPFMQKYFVQGVMIGAIKG
ncbi:MAG: carbohydrate ABC transporter permease [Bacillota bacterium]|nr:carbohydrate ABC transporter permease [Bacillota bacterium]